MMKTTHAFAVRAWPFACLVAFALVAPNARAEAPITPEARKHFSVGVSLLRDPTGPRYEEAYREFKLAYRASPSPKILGNLGLCAMKLERDAEAIAAYQTYLRETKDVSAAEREQMDRDLVTLQSGVVHLTVVSDPPGALVEDSRRPVHDAPIVNSYGPIQEPTKLGVRQGRHTLIARLAGYPEERWEFDSEGGAELPVHTFQFRKAEPRPELAPDAIEKTRPIPPLVYIGAGVTVVLGAATAIVGARALSNHRQYDEENRLHNTDQASSLRDDGQRLNIATDVLLGATVVAFAVTTILFFSRPTHERRAAAFLFPSSVGLRGRHGSAAWTF
jgi:hypothetical protein